jgi:hypothetical protein
MNRLKALYRGWGIPCGGTEVYAPRYREEWLNKILQAGLRRRAELLYQQLDGLQALRREVRPAFLAESRKHKAAKLLRQIPCIGRIRAARLIALMQNPDPRGGKLGSSSFPFNCGRILTRFGKTGENAECLQKPRIVDRVPNLDTLPTREHMKQHSMSHDELIGGGKTHALAFVRAVERIPVGTFSPSPKIS